MSVSSSTSSPRTARSRTRDPLRSTDRLSVLLEDGHRANRDVAAPFDSGCGRKRVPVDGPAAIGLLQGGEAFEVGGDDLWLDQGAERGARARRVVEHMECFVLGAAFHLQRAVRGDE